ncbi:MAG TPA: hypothetical protein VKK31_09405 [Thermoanaerobaculia bacterium]|nr:hypothetical protein [Thermoanaerobaculia bacterium]
MADEKELTFEAIDAHIKNADLAAFAPGGKHHVTSDMVAAAPGNVLGQVCQIYHVIRPILQGILLIPFIPAAWKTAIRTFMSLMDTLCPA